jgi:voltage-gated potassium channel
MSTLLRIFSLLTLFASILLLASLSLEVLYSRAFAEFSEIYTWAMLVVCVIFLADFLLMMLASSDRWRFLARNFVMLLVSIPYHFIIGLLGVVPGHLTTMILSAIVMLRAVMALYITLRWLIERRATRLLWVYIATVAMCTYFASLLFYEYQSPVNSSVKDFGDALWWAAMNLTTVGAEIFPVTAIGKVICVVLPIIGMAMFPVFTVYVTSLYDTNHTKSGTGVAHNDDKPISE